MTRHLLGVWNPSYAADAMDAHLRLLLANITAFRAGRIAEEDVCVFWGKVRSPHRLERLPHLDEILAMDETLHPEGERELHREALVPPSIPLRPYEWNSTMKRVSTSVPFAAKHTTLTILPAKKFGWQCAPSCPYAITCMLPSSMMCESTLPHVIS